MNSKGFKALVILISLALVSSAGAFAMVGTSSRAVAADNQWIAVPAWLAGTWQTRVQTFLEVYDYRTEQQLVKEPTDIQVSRLRTVGAQQDATGQIWHYVATPFMRNSETETHFESQTIQRLSVLQSDANLLSLRTDGVVSRWSKETRQKIDNFYEITIATYIPLYSGRIKTDLQVADYDTNGRPLRLSHSMCVERCVKPFAAIDRDERGDLHEKFLRFMAERNVASKQSGAPSLQSPSTR